MPRWGTSIMNDHIVIVGGGILGSLIATRILEFHPHARLTLIDRSMVGTGASMYSAGVHFPVGSTARIRAMSIASGEYYRAINNRAVRAAIHETCFRVGSDRANAAFTTDRCVGLRPSSPPPDLGDFGTSDFQWWDLPGCHVADVYAVVGALACDLRKKIDLLEGVEVVQIHETATSVSVTTATGEVISGDRLVICPGPWVNEKPFAEFTSGLGARVKKVVALHLDDFPVQDAGLLFAHEDVFIAPVPHRNHWLFSYTCQQWDIAPNSSALGITGRELLEARHWLAQLAPLLNIELKAGRVFCDAYSPTREPLIESVGVSGNIIYAGAANGAGYRLAPEIARITALTLFS